MISSLSGAGARSASQTFKPEFSSDAFCTCPTLLVACSEELGPRELNTMKPKRDETVFYYRGKILQESQVVRCPVKNCLVSLEVRCLHLAASAPEQPSAARLHVDAEAANRHCFPLQTENKRASIPPPNIYTGIIRNLVVLGKFVHQSSTARGLPHPQLHTLLACTS